MSRKSEPPPYPTNDLYEWARKIVAYLQDDLEEQELVATTVKLQIRRPTDKAVIDGLVMFDPQLGEPVYSSGGVWKKMDGTNA